MKITFFADPSLVIIAIYLIGLIPALVYSRRREEILHFHYIATPQYTNPCPRSLTRPFLGHYNYTLSLSDLCLGEEETILREIMHFHNIIYGHVLALEPLPLGSINLQIC